MNARDILNQKFEMSLKGYRVDDVDTFLSQVQNAFSQIEKEKDVLEENIKVLWSKVDKYREDEDALKEAIMSAHKQSKVIISDSHNRATELEEEAKAAIVAARQINERECAQRIDEAERILSNAHLEAEHIIAKATAGAKKIERDSKAEAELHRDVIFQTKKESDLFRERVIESISDFKDGFASILQKYYKIIEEFPYDCENNFVKDVIAEKEKQQNKPVSDLEITEDSENFSDGMEEFGTAEKTNELADVAAEAVAAVSGTSENIRAAKAIPEDVKSFTVSKSDIMSEKETDAEDGDSGYVPIVEFTSEIPDITANESVFWQKPSK